MFFIQKKKKEEKEKKIWYAAWYQNVYNVFNKPCLYL